MKELFRSFLKFIRENFVLVVILTFASVALLVYSYFQGGFVSHDTSHYLHAAESLLRGNGMQVYYGWLSSAPVGYPFLIAVVSFFTGASSYVGAKILSIVLIWAIGITFYKRFGRMAWAYSLPILSMPFLEIFFYSWSEAPFILILILFSFWVSDAIVSSEVKKSQYVKLALGAMGLFLVRYVGALAVGVIGLLLIYSVYRWLKLRDKKAKKQARYLFIACLASGACVAVCFGLNLLMTGYLAGGVQSWPAVDIGRTLASLYTAQMAEVKYLLQPLIGIKSNLLALLIIILLVAFVVVVIVRGRKDIRERKKDIIVPLSFMAIGAIYWGVLFATSLVKDIYPYSSRFLFPSSFLWFIGLIGLLVRWRSRVGDFFVKYSGLSMVSVGICVFLCLQSNASTPSLYMTSDIGYKEMRSQILARYEQVPDNSVVLFGDDQLLYLRYDVHAIPHYRVSWLEGLEDLYSSYENYDAIYLDAEKMGWYLSEGKLIGDTEVINFLTQFAEKGEVLVRIR